MKCEIKKHEGEKQKVTLPVTTVFTADYCEIILTKCYCYSKPFKTARSFKKLDSYSFLKIISLNLSESTSLRFCQIFSDISFVFALTQYFQAVIKP